jgi:hypothetical protein
MMESKAYWVDSDPVAGEVFSVGCDPRDRGIQNSLHWGYRWIPIPSDVVVAFGARAIWRKSGPEFVGDRIHWTNSEDGMVVIDHHNVDLISWITDKIRSVRWDRVNVVDEAYYMSKEMKDSTFKLHFYAGKTGYVYLTAWKELCNGK